MATKHVNKASKEGSSPNTVDMKTNPIREQFRELLAMHLSSLDKAWESPSESDFEKAEHLIMLALDTTLDAVISEMEAKKIKGATDSDLEYIINVERNATLEQSIQLIKSLQGK